MMMKANNMSTGKVQVRCLSNVNARGLPLAQRSRKVQERHVRCYSKSEPDISSSIDEDTIASGEWPANWSLASYEDVGEYYTGKLFKEGVQTENTVGGIMNASVVCAKETDPAKGVEELFLGISGVPVIDAANRCVGVVCKKDLPKAGKTVGDIMTSPAVTIKKANSVAEAAAVMLKYKVDRLPVVSSKGEVCGIVSRTDLFTALESMDES